MSSGYVSIKIAYTVGSKKAPPLSPNFAPDFGGRNLGKVGAFFLDNDKLREFWIILDNFGQNLKFGQNFKFGQFGQIWTIWTIWDFYGFYVCGNTKLCYFPEC